MSLRRPGTFAPPSVLSRFASNAVLPTRYSCGQSFGNHGRRSSDQKLLGSWTKVSKALYLRYGLEHYRISRSLNQIQHRSQWTTDDPGRIPEASS